MATGNTFFSKIFDEVLRPERRTTIQVNEFRRPTKRK